MFDRNETHNSKGKQAFHSVSSEVDTGSREQPRHQRNLRPFRSVAGLRRARLKWLMASR